MRRLLPALAFAVLCRAQGGPPLERILDFEADHTGTAPTGWNSNNSTVALDDQVVHGGKWSARIERRPGDANGFGGILKFIPIDFSGGRIELRGYLRSEDVTDYVGMWLRVDGEGRGGLAFDTIQGLQVKGTTGWKEYSVQVPLNSDGRQVYFGVFVAGTGKVWADDLQLLVDGKPVSAAPKVERPKTVVDTDQEFDAGSKISVTSLTPMQVENLVTLGQVWGFLKYHHPAVTSGKRHWDYELFRIMPAILAAPDRAAANRALVEWIGRLGEIAACDPCATLKRDDLQLSPALDWIGDKARLGDELSAALGRIHTNRPASGKQFYLSLAPGVGNPSFQHEPAYQNMKIPDTGLQVLAVFRLWNIVEYWFPNREIIGENWGTVLRESLPKVALARDRETYQRELMALIARVHDTHANLWSSLGVRPPAGACQLPVNMRFIGDQAVVAGYSDEAAGKATGLRPGDVIAEVDGAGVAKLVAEWSPYYAASNDPTRLRDIARSMTRGACAEAKLRVLRDGEELAIQTPRVSSSGLKPATTHDKPGETFQRLSPEVAYLKLSSIKGADVARYVDSANGTRGLIIDIRNYPSEFVVFALGQLLVPEKTEFVRFTTGDLSNPGAFHWTPPLSLSPAKPHYTGKVVILVDEVSQSQAEYTTMALRVAPGAKVIGSTTAGADGNVSAIPLPGGLNSMISGIGVFYPDKRPTQRVGILPDREVKPTIGGIRAGRDELLDAAIAEIPKN
jgi:C-terminal processing protease CtpA/Prc